MKSFRNMTAVLWLVLLLLLTFLAIGCGKDQLTVIGKPNPDAIPVTPSAAQIGMNKFQDKEIQVRMTFKEEKPSQDPLVKMFIFRGEEREFAIMAHAGEYHEVLSKLKPGELCLIYGVLKPPESEKFVQVILQ